MRDRRTLSRRAAVRPADNVGAAIAPRLWARLLHRPVDALVILGAGAASLTIVVNAVFLQSPLRPGPFLANPKSPQPVAESRPNLAVIPAPRPAELNFLRSPSGQRASQPVSARRNDPIGDLIGLSIGPSSRVMAVQRVLSEFGYGQIRPSGFLDEQTGAAIERFESEHRLPVSGRLSDRLVSKLAAMIGHAIE